jgi:hypothetical protein
VRQSTKANIDTLTHGDDQSIVSPFELQAFTKFIDMLMLLVLLLLSLHIHACECTLKKKETEAEHIHRNNKKWNCPV